MTTDIGRWAPHKDRPDDAFFMVASAPGWVVDVWETPRTPGAWTWMVNFHDVEQARGQLETPWAAVAKTAARRQLRRLIAAYGRKQ